MTVGGFSYILRENQVNPGDNVVYAGRGLREGECGARIRNIREEWNGNVSCVLPPQSGNIEVTATMRLLVARAPGEVQLVSPQQPVFREGDRFDAMCVVPDGRPAAKITWYLDDTQLLENIHQPVLSPQTPDDLQTISQNVTRTLTADDDGRRLVCRAEHAALQRPREATRQLSVHYPPKRLEAGQITMFGLKLSAEGRLNVTVRANPPPRAEWTVAEQRLVAPQSSDDGSVTALEPIHLGGGYYNLSLVLARVSKEDVDRVYYLRARNDLGQEEFAVRISTMDEPAGVELDAGAIVGIVVAVLVLLLAVFLAVFAKATDRWCFAGSPPPDADSEAPLPPHDDVKGAENPSHDHEYIGNGDTKKPDTAV
ncbi:hypothetical protein MSG28_015281 [Choristoneura fumiferana]|uniref:Uncharacterized protein n=1 Tax=Choristoneura fumiferana TaxID=7141 RepID=A0ACC0K9S0_CHOFU|nr:hypothetical protein MSG28_015281 [Choristoneura fumiferana]